MSEATALPANWRLERFGDVAKTASGGTPSRSDSRNFGGDIPWVKSGELRDGLVCEAEETLSELGLGNSSAKVFPKGTVCLALYGATVGKLGILGIDAATNQAVCGFFLPDDIETKYAYYYLRSIRRYLVQQAKGGAQPNISQDIVKNLFVPIAPTNEQRKIVSKIEELFSDLDTGIASLETVRAKLKRYRASVLKAAVEGQLTAQWRAEHPDTEPAAKLLERILTERRQKWETAQLKKYADAGKAPPKRWQEKYPEPAVPKAAELPDLPAGWCWTTIEQLNVAERPISYGVLQPGSDLADGVPLVRVCDVMDGIILEEQLKKIDPKISMQFQRTILDGGEVLLTIVGTIGRTAVVPDSLKGANTARAVAVIPVVSEISPRYLELCLREEGMRNRLTQASHEVARKTLNLEDVRPACIPLAPKLEQAEILQSAEAALSSVTHAEAEIEHALVRAARLRQAILKRAFEGRLV